MTPHRTSVHIEIIAFKPVKQAVKRLVAARADHFGFYTFERLLQVRPQPGRQALVSNGKQHEVFLFDMCCPTILSVAAKDTLGHADDDESVGVDRGDGIFQVRNA